MKLITKISAVLILFLTMPVLAQAPGEKVREEIRESTHIQSNSQSSQSSSQFGIASWYGESDKECRGCSPLRITSCGDKFRETEFTLANNHFSCGQFVAVCRMAGGKCITARVTDTGGFPRFGRIADLSKATFAALSSLSEGLIEVKISLLP